RLAHVPEREIDEAVLDPAYRVQDAHRALHDVGEVLPADRAEVRLRAAVELDAAVAEIEAHRAADDVERRASGGGDGLDQRGLAGTRFAREPVDLIGLDAQTHVVDGAYLAPYAILIDQVI